MNIGIDAKWFFNGNPSGRVVVQNLIRELIYSDKQNQYFIFLRKEDKGKEFPYCEKNVRLVYIWSGNNLLSNVFITPYYAFRFRLDVFLYQYFGPFIKFSKVVTLIHDVIFESNPEYFSWKERAYFRPMRWLAKRADKIITVSQNEKNRLIHYKYGSKEKIKIIHLGVSNLFSQHGLRDEKQIDSIREKYKLPERFVLYVGRLNYRKNIHNLIRSFAYVWDDNIKLVLVGGYDWKMFDVKSYISDLGLQSKIQLLGFVDDEDLPRIYSACEIFCFVSFEEGFGLPPLEAMATGAAIVVANKGSLPEICGEAGFYIDPNSPADIADAINQLFSNPKLLLDFKQKSLKTAANFCWNKTANEYLNSFEELVSKK